MKTFNTEFGTFTLDEERDSKMARSFATEGSHQRLDLLVLRPFISKEMTLVDVGAHIGTFSIPFARLAKRVYAIEPMPPTFALLEKNIKDNGVENIIPLNYGISEHADTLYAEEVHNRAATFFREKENGGTQVPARPLDQLIPEQENVGLIKIDVEGMELAVLKSAERIFKKNRPLIFFEVNTAALARHRITRSMLERFIRSKGYMLFRPAPAPAGSSQVELARIFSFYQGQFFDCLAVPKEKVNFTYLSASRFMLGQLGRKIKRVLQYGA